MNELSSHICWWSNQDSVKQGKISILAFAEILIGIWLYWWVIPEFTENYWHIWISILILPFLLLKSDLSVSYALDKYTDILNGRLNNNSVTLHLLIFFCIINYLFYYFSFEFITRREAGRTFIEI